MNKPGNSGKMRKIMPIAATGRQAGIVLPIALILLLVSTLIGVTSLRSNSLSEKMTRNTMQRELAFSRAETALLEGEALVDANATAIKAVIVGAAASDDCSAQFPVPQPGGGTANEKGFCSPANHPQGGGAASNTERWEIPTLWSDTAAERYITATVPNTKYIVEFVGHVFGSDNSTNCAPTLPWPYCETDGLQFRITATADGFAPGEARVILQSTYVAAP